MELVGVLFKAGGTTATTIERSFTVPWTEDGLAEVFPELVAADKLRVRMWSPASYKVGHKRCNAGLEQLHAAVLDIDAADIGHLARVVAALQAGGLAAFVHSSYSHMRPGKYHKGSGLTGTFEAFRVILPLSRPVEPDEYRVLVPALVGAEVPADPPHYAAEVLGKFVETRSGIERAAQPRGIDPTSSQPARAYFVPATSPELAEHAVFQVLQGRSVDVDEVLRRPTTTPAWRVRSRSYQAPSAVAVGALRDVVAAFARRGVQLGAEGHAGWRRAPCPVCAPSGHQASPSFTVRANGDAIDFYCHSSDCYRRPRAAFLEALGLEASGRFAAPDEVLLQVEEQLARQAAGDAAVPVDEATRRLTADIRDAVESREATVIQYPAGSGKSYSSAIVLAERARAGFRICYSTAEHKVAAETRAYLPPDVLASSVHLHSPLLQVGDDPVCARAEELKTRVFEFGVSMLGKVCPTCPLRDGCEAYAATKDRYKKLASAKVVFVSHAGIDQVYGADADGQLKGADTELIVDEMPATYERVEVTPHQLRALRTAELSAASPTIAKAVREIARAWLAGETPGDVTWGPENASLGSALGIAAEWGRLVVREDARPSAAEQTELKAADALVRLAAHHAEAGTVQGLEARGAIALSAMLPDACHRALMRRQGVLLTATPLMAALPGFQVRACQVQDGAKVRRIMVPKGGRGRMALTTSYWDDVTGRRVRRDPRPGEGPGIPWPVVDSAIEMALGEAQRYECKRVLVCTFKTVADALRRDPKRLRGGLVQVAHYGALRGKNDYMEGKAAECSVALLLGAPRGDTMPTILQLGLVGEAADWAWRGIAAAEMTQAEGRLRLPRRTKPCSVIAVGDVAPSSWTTDMVDEWRELEPEPESALYEAALFWRTCAEVDSLLADGEPLTELASPKLDEVFGLLVALPPARQALLAGEFTWAD